jgi:hypothetical protein
VPQPAEARLPGCRCAHEYKPHTELPYGDTVTGGKWKKPFPDPGTYDGAEALKLVKV